MENPIKTIILNTLDYMRQQVLEDKCTAEELRTIHDTVLDGISVDASISDIAEFYGRKNVDVSNVIHRRPSKSKKKVYYSFNWFEKIKPKSWKRDKQLSY